MDEVTWRTDVLIPSVAVRADVLRLGVFIAGVMVILEPWARIVGPVPNCIIPVVPPVICILLVWTVLVVRVVPT